MDRTEENAILRTMLENVQQLRQGYVNRLSNRDQWNHQHLEVVKVRVTDLQAQELQLLRWLYE